MNMRPNRGVRWCTHCVPSKSSIVSVFQWYCGTVSSGSETPPDESSCVLEDAIGSVESGMENNLSVPSLCISFVERCAWGHFGSRGLRTWIDFVALRRPSGPLQRNDRLRRDGGPSDAR